ALYVFSGSIRGRGSPATGKLPIVDGRVECPVYHLQVACEAVPHPEPGPGSQARHRIYRVKPEPDAHSVWLAGRLAYNCSQASDIHCCTPISAPGLPSLTFRFITRTLRLCSP